MEPYTLSILVTVCNSLLMMYLAVNVGLTRIKTKTPAYKNTKDEAVNIANRVHMNTVENTVVYIPLLWVATVFGSAMVAGILGGVWFLARIWYSFAYLQEPTSRRNPFLLSVACMVFTILVAIYGVIL